MEVGKGKAFAHRSSGHNFFPTHYSLTEQLLEVEDFDYSSPVLEPACGKLDMVKVLDKYFNIVEYYDIDSAYCENKNFYDETKKYKTLITNPPYGEEADKFVIKAKEVVTHKFAMLLRTNYLSGVKRYRAGVYHELKNIWIFTRMPDLTAPIREDGKYPTTAIVYAWLVWEIGYKGLPVVGWIDNQKYVLKKGD